MKTPKIIAFPLRKKPLNSLPEWQDHIRLDFPIRIVRRRGNQITVLPRANFIVMPKRPTDQDGR
jgi:hypothetical protein